MKQSKKILITGLHGFVGSNFTKAFVQYHDIYGLDIVSPLKSSVQKTFNWDELQELPHVNTIIHLAGKAHDTVNYSKEKAYFDSKPTV